tara:strand:- start:52139 stop:52378 length:240 start_codon:yes stop_codon:yes gene_type:complete
MKMFDNRFEIEYKHARLATQFLRTQNAENSRPLNKKSAEDFVILLKALNHKVQEIQEIKPSFKNKTPLWLDSIYSQGYF